MIATLNDLTKNLSGIFFLRQLLVVTALFAVGFLCVYSVSNSKNKDEKVPYIYSFLLAFPVGTAIVTCSGLFLFIFGIKYSILSLVVTAVLLVCAILFLSKPSVNKDDFKGKKLLLFVLSLILLVVSVSGIISVGFSNDSMYYYSAYPHELVANGYLSYKYDVNLTDAGLGTALINTLPFLFGFNESFGIHNAFNISFICFFFYAVYEQAAMKQKKREAVIFSLLATLVLVTSMPYVLISKWIIANMYFMDTMFICLYLNFRFCNRTNNMIAVRMLLLLMLSFIRVEGAIFACFLMMIYLTKENAKKREVILSIIPVTVFQAAYFLKIYVSMKILATYTFMTREKAVVAVAFCIFVMVYGALFAGDSIAPNIKQKLSVLSPLPIMAAGLIGINGLLFIYNRGLFISNVEAFIMNFTTNSGWGYFVAFVFVLIVLVPKVKIEDNYFDYFSIGFFLVAFAACFARGDNLRVDLYDSGNRVMLQIVPFIIYGFAYRYIMAFDILRQKEQ